MIILNPPAMKLVLLKKINNPEIWPFTHILESEYSDILHKQTQKHLHKMHTYTTLIKWNSNHLLTFRNANKSNYT